ncbi:MAG TPA: helix-turn-helix domain-containing protein [Mycobacteriales bacterium]|nr:helix-turn-helix domain-containing protein [Mycobacteriales bacterium]
MARREEAIRLLATGVSRREVCRQLGVGYSSLYRWEIQVNPKVRASKIRCFRCDRTDPHESYTYLLGQYLGDGHIAPSGRSQALRIACTRAYPLIIAETAAAMRAVAGTSVNYQTRDGCTLVNSATVHWLCMLPQHGRGMKHTRPIVLTDWQEEIIKSNPRGLIRGLIHSDGCRATNTVHRPLPSGLYTYHYPRYFFSNESADIRQIFTDALDLLGIAWKQNRRNSISIARREAVAALDEFVGPKA